MSAAPIGCSFDGARLERPKPWSVLLPYAEIRWSALRRAPSGEVLRGAIIAALGREEAHVDYHHHREDGSTVEAPATVLYRGQGQPRVWMYGPRAHDHARELAELTRVRIGDRYQELGCGVVLQGLHDIQVSGRQWFRYRSVSPLVLPERWWRREPSGVAERCAWMQLVLQGYIHTLCEHIGLEMRQRLAVHVEGVERTRVRIKGAAAPAFEVEWVSNVDLPPGVGLGKHRAFGFGEMECGC